jgi:uncharacterized protein YbcI
VRVVAEYTARGPTRARTTISGEWVFVSLEDTLTKGERKLADTGNAEFVIEARRRCQSAMRDADALPRGPSERAGVAPMTT